jgi:PAS domain S-box-containing protein
LAVTKAGEPTMGEATMTELGRRYQEAFEFAPEAYLSTDATGIIRRANRAAMELLDADRESLVDKPLAFYLAEGAREGFQARLRSLREHRGQTSRWRTTFTDRRGSGRPFETVVSVSGVRDDGCRFWFALPVQASGNEAA